MKKLIFILSILLLVGCTPPTVEQEMPEVESDLEQKEFLFKKKGECWEICEPLYQEDVKSLPNEPLFSPRYYYSKEDNTCYYLSGFLGVSGGVTSVVKWIRDCLTNEEVAGYSLYDGKPSSKIEYEDYEEMESKLMGFD